MHALLEPWGVGVCVSMLAMQRIRNVRAVWAGRGDGVCGCLQCNDIRAGYHGASTTGDANQKCALACGPPPYQLLRQRTIVGQPFQADAVCPNSVTLGKRVRLESLTYLQRR